MVISNPWTLSVDTGVFFYSVNETGRGLSRGDSKPLTLDHPPAILSKLSYYEDVWPELTETHKYHPPPIALHHAIPTTEPGFTGESI
jgi:hypothetical protein